MKPLNMLLTLSSLNVLLVTIERFSPTTQVVLQPGNFLRLHELVQISLLILLTVLIPCFILYTITGRGEALQRTTGKVLLVLFIIGTYFYATGNGAHEISSFLFNSYCPQNNFVTTSCISMFLDDYYFGNVVYFIGAFLMTIPLVLLEKMQPSNSWTQRDYVVLVINSLVYSFAITAYAAFDRVLVGLIYVLISTVCIDIIALWARTRVTRLPFTIYTALSYTVGALLALVIRFSQ